MVELSQLTQDNELKQARKLAEFEELKRENAVLKQQLETALDQSGRLFMRVAELVDTVERQNAQLVFPKCRFMFCEASVLNEGDACKECFESQPN